MHLHFFPAADVGQLLDLHYVYQDIVVDEDVIVQPRDILIEQHCAGQILQMY